MPLKLFQQLWHALLHRAGNAVIRARQALLAVRRTLLRNKAGINLVGYFSSTSGVAEVGRFFARFTERAAVPFVIHDIDAPGYKKLDAMSLQAYQPYFTRRTIFYKNIFFINADQIPVVRQIFPYLFTGRYNAAVFFWEFNDYFYFPEAFRFLHEAVAFTDFIVTAVRKAAPPGIRVTKLPFPFSQNWQITRPPAQVRGQLGISEDEFVFIFNFDFLSVYKRKNPEAIIRALEQAFVPADRVRLILKTIHGEAGSPHYACFQKLVEGMQLKSKLLVINENLERNELMNMINASDCYVSLHRSEGLGLGMLEAMSMAKPVIATNFGGNTDFTRADNALLVEYELTEVGKGAEPYQAGWLWAEPNIAQASLHMRKLYLDREYAYSLGLRAQQSVKEQYNDAVFRKSLDEWMKP